MILKILHPKCSLVGHAWGIVDKEPFYAYMNGSSLKNLIKSSSKSQPNETDSGRDNFRKSSVDQSISLLLMSEC